MTSGASERGWQGRRPTLGGGPGCSRGAYGQRVRSIAAAGRAEMGYHPYSPRNGPARRPVPNRSEGGRFQRDEAGSRPKPYKEENREESQR